MLWMTLPFLSAFGVMKLLSETSDRAQRIAFVLILLLCAIGQILALAQINSASPPTPEWKLLLYALRLIAFVCLFSFTAYTLIAAYFLFHPKPQ
jgi:hypothetical protein